MPTEWKQALMQHCRAADISQTLSQIDSQEDYLCLLDQIGILSVEGLDSQTFLQGQVTCDMQELDQNHYRLGAHCNHKGRMISNFLVTQADPQHFLMRTDRSSADALFTSLSKYIVFSKASIQIVSNDFVRLGLIGKNAHKYAAQLTGHQFSSKDQVVRFAENDSIALNISDTRCELWLKAANVTQLLEIIPKHTVLGGQPYWNWENIKDGLGEVREPTIEKLLPQEINYQFINGISFNKGCYTGQEVIARMHFRGKMKKSMQHIEYTSREELVPLTPITDIDSQSNAGFIIMSERISTDTFAALAVLSNVSVENNSLTVAEGAPAKVVGLPYPLSETDK